MNNSVLRSLGYFSHTTITSRHHTYRQSYNLILSPAQQSVVPSPLTRNTTGTTVSVKELFANFPVRQSFLQSNRQAEMTEIIAISLGIALTRPVSLSLRNGNGDRIFKLAKNIRQWDIAVLREILTCHALSCKDFNFEQEDISISAKLYMADTPKNHFFCCKSFFSR